MKLILNGQKFNAKYLNVSAKIRYWEDAKVNGAEDISGDLIPCRNGEYWEPVINLETGRIANWAQGVFADIHYKVCDEGAYTLRGENAEQIACIDGYVPKIMCPGGEGYGDHIIMKINEFGFIEKWKARFNEFDSAEEE